MAVPLLAVPTLALAGPSQSSGARVRVVVDAKALGEAGALYEEEVGARLRAAIEEAGYVLDDSVRSGATVRLRITFYNEADADYQVHVDISAGAELVQLETFGCPQCVDEALLGAIQGQQTEILAGLERALVQAAERTQPANEGESSAPPTSPTPEHKPIGALGVVGIGMTAVGVGALIAGGVELGRGLVYDDLTQTPTERTFIDHRPAGGALLGTGGVLLAAGVTMLVVDVVRSKNRRRAQQAGNAHPLLGPSLVGVGYSGRF